jgi:hypothetical protein
MRITREAVIEVSKVKYGKGRERLGEMVTREATQTCVFKSGDVLLLFCLLDAAWSS